MTSFFAFMASAAGRITRIAAGVVLIVVGVLLGGGWWALAVVGLVPLAAGFSMCACSRRCSAGRSTVPGSAPPRPAQRSADSRPD